jgi:uncharacterized protein (DUF2252 family)
MNIHKATESFENWLAKHIQIVKPDLEFKHQEMTASVFSFFRATFYRWLQLWQGTCPDEDSAPRLLAVGDLHVENFGTWRDIEGRLIWGINDFDEVYSMPYTMDLVRLATSAHLAVEAEHLAIRRRDACDAVLEGYRNGLQSGGRPFVLAEQHRWLRLLALNKLRDPVRFWKKMEGFPAFRGGVQGDVRRELEKLLPEPGLAYICKQRVAGLGSLGHQRLVALAEWRGGYVAREAKALRPSACLWAAGARGPQDIRCSDIIGRAVRVPDPFVRPYGNWLLRRLAPDCSRIELASLPEQKDEEQLLYSMGWETANVHLGSKDSIRAIEKDLKKRRAKWLHFAAKQMAKAVRRDWGKWRGANRN